MEKSERLVLKSAPEWTNSPSEKQILDSIKNTDLMQKQLDENKDHCYFLDKKFWTSNEYNIDYTSMLYTVTQTGSLEFTSVYEIFLGKKEHLEMNRVFVVRDGEVIEKLADADMKILDNETESSDGVIGNGKKINIRFHDIRINDIFYIEYTVVDHIEQEDFLKQKYIKKIFHQPSSYWSYDRTSSEFLNHRKENVAYQKYYFRDEKNNIIDDKKQVLKPGETFFLELKNFNSDEAVDQEKFLNPYIDFATDEDWKQIGNYLGQYYEKALEDDISDQSEYIFSSIENFSQPQKIRYIIEYVQNNIKYVFDAEDMHGHKPQNPSITLKSKQGDCKAKVVLLTSLLRKIGVDADPVLVNFSADFFLNHYLPSPLSLNHVIVKINENGKDYFVDATSTNQFGTLENRSKIMFLNYLDLKQGLKQTESLKWPDFGLVSKVNFDAKKNKGHIVVQDTYRYSRADGIRKTLRSKSKKDVLTLWEDLIFTNLCYGQDRNNLSNKDIFENSKFEVLVDDKDKNEMKVIFESDIINPYVQRDEKRFLMYFESMFIKKDYINFVHLDYPIFLTADPLKIDVTLSSDERIFTKEKYTIQELKLKNKYFSFESKKNIKSNSGNVIIEFFPIANIEVEKKDEEKLKKDFYEISHSNHGLGIDIKEPGISNKFKRLFDKRTYGKL